MKNRVVDEFDHYDIFDFKYKDIVLLSNGNYKVKGKNYFYGVIDKNENIIECAK